MKREAIGVLLLLALGGPPAAAQIVAQEPRPVPKVVGPKIELQPTGELETRLSGWVDLHTHPMSHLGFGGKAMHGAPDVDILVPAETSLGCGEAERRARDMAEALGSCNPTHGGWGLDNTCGDYLRAAVISTALDPGFWYVVGMADNLHNDHSHPGHPDFDYWPHFSSKLHQQMWWEWLERAHAGGLRVLVALTVNSETLAEVLNGDPPYDDKSVADRQIDETIRYVNRHRDFMEVALTAADAERIIRSGRMAVILGMEVDKLGNFGKPGVRTDERAVREEIRRLHARGVRYVFPIHLIDNAFGGTAVYSPLFNMANRNQNGSLYEIATSPDPLVDYEAWVTRAPGVETAAWHALHPILELIGGLPAPPDCFDLIKCRGLPFPCVRGCGSYARISDILRPSGPEFDAYSLVDPGHVNARGLTPLGRVAIDELMRLGMLIDVDHMSERSLRETVGLADAVDGDYPLILGHTKVRGPGGSERDAPADVVRQIARLGGMMGLGTTEQGPAEVIERYNRAVGALGAGAGAARERGFFAVGTDVNGFEQLPHRGSSVTSGHDDGPLRAPVSPERVVTVPGDAWNEPPARLSCASGLIDVRSARIGCLDIQRSDNLTTVVAAACTGRSSCAFQAPTESEYLAMGVLASTRSHCTQAMEVVFRCSTSPSMETESQRFYNTFFRDSGISSRQRKPNGESWDYIEEHGVSHYGLMPEFLHDVSLRAPSAYSSLLRGADGFVRLWSKAEAASRLLTGGGGESALVSLRSHHGRYVVAEPDGSAKADRERVGAWEKLVMIENGDGSVSFRGAHAMYLVAEPDGGAKADRRQIGAWERFERIDNSDGTVSFRGAHGMYLVAEPDGSLNANRTAIGAWEKFRVTAIP